MKKLILTLLCSVLLLASCAEKNSQPVNPEQNLVKVELGEVPYAWKVPKNIVSHLTIQTPNNEYSDVAKNNGAQAQALVYYKPESGETTIFMAVYYFPINSYLVANHSDEPPAFGNRVLEANNMILSIAGPQDSMFDPKTADGKNINLLYKTLYDASNYTNATPKSLNPGEVDTVSSWTSSIVSQAVADLTKQTKLNPTAIYQHAKLLKDSFADGDAGVVTKTLTGAKVTFKLGNTTASANLFLDSKGKLNATKTFSNPTPEPLRGCFMGSLKQDRYYLNILTQEGLNVTGKITINNSQKDSSNGTFIGTFDGTILTGMYAFSSEGVQSERELFFKATGDSLLQGFGPVEENGNTAKFVRPLNITWDNSYLLNYSSNCK